MGVETVERARVKHCGLRVKRCGLRTADCGPVTAALIALFVAASASAQTASSVDAPVAAPSTSRATIDVATHALVVAGIGGERRYSAEFAEWGTRIRDGLALRIGGDSMVALLLDEPARDPRKLAGISSRDTLLARIAKIGSRAKAGDQVIIILIGHGSPGTGGDPRLVLPGPDLTASDLGAALTGLAAQRVAVINAASAGGDYPRLLSAANRVIISATKSAYERNETRFARYFADALSGEAADTDKDGKLSLLETYMYAKRETARAYEEEKRLLTEHAMLEDNGDGTPTAAPDPSTGKDGPLARSFVIAAPRGAATPAANARVADLVRQRETVERELRELATRKTQMDSVAYDRALEEVMIRLARAAQAVRDAEAAPAATTTPTPPRP